MKRTGKNGFITNHTNWKNTPCPKTNKPQNKQTNKNLTSSNINYVIGFMGVVLHSRNLRFPLWYFDPNTICT